MSNFPLTDFSFTVQFGLLPVMPVDNQFMVVSGLNTTAEAQQPSTSSTPSSTPIGAATGELAPVNKSGFTTVYSPLVLKRGLPLVSVVSAWCIDAFENNHYQPIDIKVVLLDAQQTPLSTWHFSKALPIKRELSDFNSNESSLVIETITLSYAFLKTISESSGLLLKNIVTVNPNF
jgi:phage tail-like protein